MDHPSTFFEGAQQSPNFHFRLCAINYAGTSSVFRPGKTPTRVCVCVSSSAQEQEQMHGTRLFIYFLSWKVTPENAYILFSRYILNLVIIDNPLLCLSYTQVSKCQPWWTPPPHATFFFFLFGTTSGSGRGKPAFSPKTEMRVGWEYRQVSTDQLQT